MNRRTFLRGAAALGGLLAAHASHDGAIAYASPGSSPDRLLA